MQAREAFECCFNLTRSSMIQVLDTKSTREQVNYNEPIYFVSPVFISCSFSTSEVTDDPGTLNIEADGVEDRRFLANQTGEPRIPKYD